MVRKAGWRVRLSVNFSRALWSFNGFRGDGPHFNSLTELETGAVLGYLDGLFKTVRLK